MRNIYYNESLIEVVEKLTKIRQSLLDSVLDIAITGELAEWNKTIEVGTAIKFSQDMFEGCSDSNIHLLLRLIGNAEQTANSLLNINGLEL